MPSFKEVAADMAREAREEELRQNNLKYELMGRAKLVADDFNQYASESGLSVTAVVDDDAVVFQDESDEEYIVTPQEGGLFALKTRPKDKYFGSLNAQIYDRNGVEVEAMQRYVIAWAKAPRSKFS